MQPSHSPAQPRPRLFSFRTDTGDTSPCTSLGDTLIAHLAAVLRSHSFLVDATTDWPGDDWVVFAQRETDVLGISLNLFSHQPCRWFICLIDQHGNMLQKTELQDELHQTLYTAFTQLPLVSELRWHDDPTTLRELVTFPATKQP